MRDLAGETEARPPAGDHSPRGRSQERAAATLMSGLTLFSLPAAGVIHDVRPGRRCRPAGHLRVLTPCPSAMPPALPAAAPTDQPGPGLASDVSRPSRLGASRPVTLRSGHSLSVEGFAYGAGWGTVSPTRSKATWCSPNRGLKQHGERACERDVGSDRRESTS